MLGKTSPLSGGLIARKGDAKPSPSAAPQLKAVESQTHASPKRKPPKKGRVSGNGKPIPKGTEDTIAVTVRLDSQRYRKLKLHGVDHRMSNQEILVQALDA